MEIKDVENGRSGKEQEKKQPWILYGAIGLASIAAIIFIILFALEKGKLADAEAAAGGTGGGGKNHPDGPNGAESWKEFASNLMTFYPSKVSDFDNDGNYVVGTPLLTERHMVNKDGFRYSNEDFPDVPENNLRVMQFNMLADGLSGVYDDPTKGKAFDGPIKQENQHILYWNYRINLIVEEIRRSQASIITVQENDHHDELLKALNLKDPDNWDGRWKQKESSPCDQIGRGYNNKKKIDKDGKEEVVERRDGTSIYWRTDKVTMDEKTYLDGAYKPVEPITTNEKQIWIAAQFTIKSNEEKVWIVSTHLESDKDIKGEAVRRHQAAQLMNKIKSDMKIAKDDKQRVIFTGDLNGFDQATHAKPGDLEKMYDNLASPLVNPIELNDLKNVNDYVSLPGFKGLWYTGDGDVLKFLDNDKVDYTPYGREKVQIELNKDAKFDVFSFKDTATDPLFKCSIPKFNKIATLIASKVKTEKYDENGKPVNMLKKNKDGTPKKDNGKDILDFQSSEIMMSPASIYIFDGENGKKVAPDNKLKINQFLGHKFRTSNANEMEVRYTNDGKNNYEIRFYTIDNKTKEEFEGKSSQTYPLVVNDETAIFKMDNKTYTLELSYGLCKWTSDESTIYCYEQKDLQPFKTDINFDKSALIGTWYTPYLEEFNITRPSPGDWKIDVTTSGAGNGQTDIDVTPSTISVHGQDIKVLSLDIKIGSKTYKSGVITIGNKLVLTHTSGEKLILIKNVRNSKEKVEKHIMENLQYFPATYTFIVNDAKTWDAAKHEFIGYMDYMDTSDNKLRNYVEPFDKMAHFLKDPPLKHQYENGTPATDKKKAQPAIKTLAYTTKQEDIQLRTDLDFQSSQAQMKTQGPGNPVGEPFCTTIKIRGGSEEIHTEDFIFFRGDLTPVGYMSYSTPEEFMALYNKIGAYAYLPRFNYPSDHIAIVTEFKLNNITSKSKKSGGDVKDETKSKKEGDKNKTEEKVEGGTEHNTSNGSGTAEAPKKEKK